MRRLAVQPSSSVTNIAGLEDWRAQWQKPNLHIA